MTGNLSSLSDRQLLEAIFEQNRAILERLETKKKRPRSSPDSLTQDLVAQLESFKNSLPPVEYERFLLYWGETDLKGTPRWKKEKTWNLAGRIRRWMLNKQERDYAKSKPSTNEQKPVRSQDGADHGFERLSFERVNSRPG